jgi:hypothetical protein
MKKGIKEALSKKRPGSRPGGSEHFRRFVPFRSAAASSSWTLHKTTRAGRVDFERGEKEASGFFLHLFSFVAGQHAILPFCTFDDDDDSDWWRWSVGGLVVWRMVGERSVLI